MGSWPYFPPEQSCSYYCRPFHCLCVVFSLPLTFLVPFLLADERSLLLAKDNLWPHASRFCRHEYEQLPIF